MKVDSSDYLYKVKPLLQKLLQHLTAEYSYASILAQDSNGYTYRTGGTGMSITENDLLTKRGFVVRIHDGNGYGEYAFNEISEDLLPEIESHIRELTPLPVGETAPKTADPVFFSESTEYQTDPSKGSGETLPERLSRIRTTAKELDARVLDCTVMCTYQQIHKLFLAPARDMEQNMLWTTGGLWIMAARGEEIKEYFKSFSGLGGAEVLDEMESAVPGIVDTVTALLDSQPIPPGEYDCVCTPEVTGMIVHEAFGHGVEMDMFVKKRALAEQFIGQYVASPLVTMHDSASCARETATFFFDDEGTMANDTVIIDRGVLVKGICDSLSACRLGTAPTGNGRRESYERKSYTRMTNTWFEGGEDSVESMIASVQYGFLLENATSGMEDPKNWGIQCMVNIAREIKDGKLTGKLYSPIVLTGYVPDLLRSISMMSKDVHLGGGGFCGKGYKEWVKVSDGGPYIKARIRLG